MVRAALLALVLVAVVLSPHLGRADPTSYYRPPLPPDALTNGCWPLPGDVELDFAYQVRTDEVVPTTAGERRRLVLHYDLVSGDEAVADARAEFVAAGVSDEVQIEATDFTGVADDAVVRGEMVLDLPPSEPEGSEICQDPSSLKRFYPGMPRMP